MENNQQVEFEREEIKKVKNGMSIAGLVLGIIGVCLSFIPIINNAAFFLGILALIFGAVPLVKKRSVAMSVTALILGILSIVITLYMQSVFVKAVDDAIDGFNDDLGYISGDKTDDILDSYLDVDFGDFTVTEDEYFDSTELVVQVKNKGEEQKSFSIQVEAVDANGNRIETDYIYANDLGAGQSQEFKVFEYVTSDKIDSLKVATFKVVEVSMY